MHETRAVRLMKATVSIESMASMATHAYGSTTEDAMYGELCCNKSPHVGPPVNIFSAAWREAGRGGLQLNRFSNFNHLFDFRGVPPQPAV